MIGRIGLLGALLATGCAATSEVERLEAVGGGVDTLQVAAFGPEFGEIRHVATDSRGNVYVADAARDVVVMLSPAGVVRETLGGPGSGDYAFLGPAGIDPTNGLSLYVADSGNGRVQRFSHEGRLLESIVLPADAEAMLAGRETEDQRGRPLAVAAADAGEVFVIDERAAVVLRYDDRRTLERVIGGASDGRGVLSEPVAIALLRDRRLAIADRGHHAVNLYDAFGTFTRRIADGSAVGVRAVAADRYHVAVVLGDRVLLYTLEGMLERVVMIDLPEPIVAGTLHDGRLIVATRNRLWR